MQFLTGFAPLAARYDGFIIDLWGVLHDGVSAYPGAVACLEALRDAGKRTVLLSNAPRRSAMAQAAMRGMGIGDDLYTGILTSGEATHMALAERLDPWFAALGRRVFHLGPERDRNVIEGIDLDRVASPEEADVVLNTGPDDHQSPIDPTEFDALLSQCAGRSLPMICANPDLEVIRDGVRVICAGALAVRYEALGGEVRWVGKPDPAIYAPVFAMLGLPPGAVMAVGDSLRTDIAGAKAAGVASAWVLGGIHADRLASDRAAVTAAVRSAGLKPEACLPRFVW